MTTFRSGFTAAFRTEGIDLAATFRLVASALLVLLLDRVRAAVSEAVSESGPMAPAGTSADASAPSGLAFAGAAPGRSPARVLRSDAGSAAKASAGGPAEAEADTLSFASVAEVAAAPSGATTGKGSSASAELAGIPKKAAHGRCRSALRSRAAR